MSYAKVSKNYFNKIIFALKKYSNSPSSIRNFEKLSEVLGGK
ncbi:hypothetical protein [uncultured Gammaproteobacteria bacterium]|nr:hypothetical protein [uncultured Gammaproteobacteria bacterium]